jgi:hypothetical protein
MKARFAKLAVIAALTIASGAIAAAPLAPRTTLYYDISMAGVVLAEGTETLEQDGRTYHISSEAKGKGIIASLYRGAIRRSAHGTVSPQGLRPAEYQDQRADKEPTRVQFDWNRKTITLHYDGKAETIPMPANALDRLSFFYQFAFIPPPAGELHVTAVDGKGTTQFNFLAPVREKLMTPLGELDTVKLTKRPDGPNDKQTEVWLAPALHNLPVRVLVTDNNGNKADQVISRIEPQP